MTKTVRIIQDWIEGRAEEMADLLVRLVAIETENPPARNLGECAEVLQRITDLVTIAADRIGADASIEVSQLALAADTALDSRAAQLLGEAVKEVNDKPAQFELCPGCLDTRWYAERGIPAFGYGPGRFEVSHGPDEYVEEAALCRVVAVYATFAAAIIAPD